MSRRVKVLVLFAFLFASFLQSLKSRYLTWKILEDYTSLKILPTAKTILDSETTTTIVDRGSNDHNFSRYHHLADAIQNMSDKFRNPFDSAYDEATVIERGRLWFQPTKICRENCCAEDVAISLDQDDNKIMNTLAGLDFADTIIRHYEHGPNLHFHSKAPYLTEDLVPCLQNGTIIQLDNHDKVLSYFFDKLRPEIKIPYLLITSQSDGNNPWFHHGRHLTDDLLMKWYGTNPDLKNVDKYNGTLKFEPMPLGLSNQHRQTPYLSSFLKLTNFTNPFLEKERWTLALNRTNNTPDNLFFVSFNVHEFAIERQLIYDSLCSKDFKPTDNISCAFSTGLRRSPKDIYKAGSKYLFGVSPPGMGWDCYRTYELLLLGVIPLIEYRPGGEELFANLPVIHVKDLLRGNWTQPELVKIAQDYVTSKEFQNNTFAGWDRLFFRYWRRKIIQDAGREIIQDERGREYYKAWRYTRRQEPVYCHKSGECGPER